MDILKFGISGCAGWSRAKSLEDSLSNLPMQTKDETCMLCLISSNSGLLYSSKIGDNLIEFNLQQQTFMLSEITWHFLQLMICTGTRQLNCI